MGCGACAEACTYGAIEFRKTKKGKKAVVNPVICKGDGLCNAKCPTGAIYPEALYRRRGLLSQIDAATGDCVDSWDGPERVGRDWRTKEVEGP